MKLTPVKSTSWLNKSKNSFRNHRKPNTYNWEKPYSICKYSGYKIKANSVLLSSNSYYWWSKQYLKSALKNTKEYTIESRPPYGAPHKIEYNQQTIEQATKVYNRMKKVKDNALRVVEILR